RCPISQAAQFALAVGRCRNSSDLRSSVKRWSIDLEFDRLWASASFADCMCLLCTHVKRLVVAGKMELQSMPRIVEYKTVLQRMRDDGFVSLYHNSGAFGFAKDAKTPFGSEPQGRRQAVGWIGADDPTIKPQVQGLGF